MSHERELESTLQGSEIISDVIDRDPANRIGITLTEQQKMFLISRAPFQPVLQTYPVNKKIPAEKQNSFSSNCFKEFPYLEYSPSSGRVYCFACSLFGDNTSCSEKSWYSEGLNQWDKMKSRGKKKKGKLAQNFTCLAYTLAVKKLNAFMDKTHHVDVALSSARKQQLVLEEKERLRN